MASTDLGMLLSVLNTHAYNGHLDALATVPAANSWLAEHEFAPVDARGLRRLRELRDQLRSSIAIGRTPSDHPELTAVAVVEDGALQLRPTNNSAVASLAVAVLGTCLDGSWHQLRLCANSDQCAVAFVDRSKNHSKRWCDAALCGNRLNTRAFRERQRSTAGRPSAAPE